MNAKDISSHANRKEVDLEQILLPHELEIHCAGKI